MKKLVIASAVAAVMASGSVMADTTLGGEVRLKLQNQGETALNSGKLTVKINGSEDLGNGMTGFAYLEMENDSADNEKSGFSNDKSYVGIKGDFGQLTLGAQSDAAGFACGGTDIFTDNSGNTCGVGAYNGTLDNAVTYVKAINALTFVVGLTFDGDLSTGEMVDLDAAQPAHGNHTVIALNYDGGMFTVGGQITSPDSDLNIEDWTVIGGTVKLGGGTLGLTYADNGNDDSNDAVAVAYSMPLAGGTIKVGVDSGDALKSSKKANPDEDTITNVEFKKSLGKSTYAGVQLSDDARNADTLFQAYMGYNF
jgi:predicted porin